MVNKKGLALVVVIILISANIPAFGIGSLQKAVVSDGRIVNLSGKTLGKNIIVNQSIQITAKITNTQDSVQDFVYIVQIKDGNGVVVKLGWISGSLTQHQSFSPSLSWIPKDSGEYSAEIYVWDSLARQEALTNFIAVEIIAS